MKKNSFILAVIFIVATYLISLIPNPNQLEKIDSIKAILGMISGVLSLIFMTMSIFFSRNDLIVSSEINNFKKKLIKISLIIGIIGACIFVFLYINHIIF